MSTKKAKSKESGQGPGAGGQGKAGDSNTADLVDDGYDRNRLITPAMAVCGMTGNPENAPVLPDAGEDRVR